MKKALFVTFDLIRPGDPKKSLSMASILATLKSDEHLKSEYTFEHLSINILAKEDWREKIKPYRLGSYSFVAISAYIWNERLINEFTEALVNSGLDGRIILGGYQIANDSLENLRWRYPRVHIFIEGYAEQALLDVFAGKFATGIIKSKLDASLLQSAYLTGEIVVEQNAEMLRLETKRGCPYSCAFCRHRDVVNDSVVELDMGRVAAELDFIISSGVRKINIVDPIFHVGKSYMSCLSKMAFLCESRGTDTQISLQCRLEFLPSGAGRDFLALCKRGNFLLEFGLQTCSELESALINRKNSLPMIETALGIMNDAGIPHEISLIYGLPAQTLESFSESAEFLKKRTIAEVKAYPLMLLPGTPLFGEKEKYRFEEEADEYGIPHVVSSSSFTRSDWLKMQNIALAM
jgi:radical SAM superfamily enzyme YgiQ (UPF0313 family)